MPERCLIKCLSKFGFCHSNNDDRAYEILSDSPKRDSYDQQMGFGRSQFQDMHFSGGSARSRAAQNAYSDDEYENINTNDRRTKPFGNRE